MTSSNSSASPNPSTKTLTLTLFPPPPASSTSSSTPSPPPPTSTASASTNPNPSSNGGRDQAPSPHRCRPPAPLRTHLQENLFFDTTASDFSSALAALRIRFYDADAKCVLSLKARAKIVDGVSRVEVIDHSVGRAIVAEPAKTASLLAESKIARRVIDEIGVNGEFVCLGGFRNVRAVYGWEEGLILELDETQYEFGTSYETECETAEPERVKVLLEGFLKEKERPSLWFSGLGSSCPKSQLKILTDSNSIYE